MEKTLGKKEFLVLIDALLAEKGLSKKQFSALVEKALYDDDTRAGLRGSGFVSKIYSDPKAFPEISYLMGMYAAIFAGGEPHKVKIELSQFKSWLLLWLEGHIEHDRLAKQKNKPPFTFVDEYWKGWLEAIHQLKRDIVVPQLSNTKLPTLNCFPESFRPLTVITGSGLTLPPQEVGDLFRGGTKFTDLLFLQKLGLPENTLIVSDRLVIDMPRRERLERFGDSNLLLVGGPKVNAVSRKFCKWGVFRFGFNRHEESFSDFYDRLNNPSTKRTLFPNPSCINMLYRILRNPALAADDHEFSDIDEVIRFEIHKKAIEILNAEGVPEHFQYPDIVDMWEPDRLIDPVSNRCHQPAIRERKDYALITIAPNLYNRTEVDEVSWSSYKGERVAVIVAGLHRLGTAAALKKLAQKESFITHKLGGFCEAEWGNGKSQFGEFLNSTCRWNDRLTPAYQVEDLIKKVGEFIPSSEKRGKDGPSALHRISDHGDLTSYLSFLQNFS